MEAWRIFAAPGGGRSPPRLTSMVLRKYARVTNAAIRDHERLGGSTRRRRLGRHQHRDTLRAVWVEAVSGVEKVAQFDGAMTRGQRHRKTTCPDLRDRSGPRARPHWARMSGAQSARDRRAVGSLTTGVPESP